MAKKKSPLKKSSKAFYFVSFKLVKRTFRKVPVIFWGTFALIGSFLVGLILGVGILEKKPPEVSPYQRESVKNAKYLNLISRYEDLSKLYTDQGANLTVAFNRDMIENHPDAVNAAILSIDQYRDTILVERGRIDELRHAAGLPPEDLRHKQSRIN